jgi:acetolactate synthase-1/2/3 large subunit
MGILGADVIVESFLEHGLCRVFTYPGGTLAPIFEACIKHNIDIFCARHEQGSGYAALAIARLTRIPQVVMVTSGPGVTNLITCIADAFFDSVPLVVITGQVGTADLTCGRKVRQCGFQQVDTIAITKSITKGVFQPLSSGELRSVMSDAFALASDGRPGPVVVDMPMDVQRAQQDTTMVPARKPAAVPERPPSGSIEKASQWLLEAKRPVILAGQGVLMADACKELRDLALSMGIPVVMSLLGLGSFPSNEPLALGFVGHTGNLYAANALQHADYVLIVGARLDLRQTGTLTDQFVPKGRKVRIDIDPDELLYPRIQVDLSINADAKQTLRDIREALPANAELDIEPWRRQVGEWKSQYRLSYERNRSTIKPQHIIEATNELTKDRSTVVVSGVGSHQQWTARHFSFDYPNRAWLTSGGHGAMGFDLPTAIGAHLARPNDLILCLVGDGSLQMNIQELKTVEETGGAIKIVVLDNSRLAMVSQFQLLTWKSDPVTGSKKNPDFAAIARAYGIRAWTLKDTQAIHSTIQAALDHKGPALVHCLVDHGEDVVPMLLAGQALDRMWPNEG